MHEVSWKPLNGAVSTQKALQGFETRVLLGGTDEKVFLDEGSLICPGLSIIWYKKGTGKIELVGRPVAFGHPYYYLESGPTGRLGLCLGVLWWTLTLSDPGSGYLKLKKK